MTDRKLHLDGLGLGLVLTLTVVWGLGQVASKVALSQVPPLIQGGLRSVGAVALVYAWARWRRIPLWDKDGTLWPGIIAGLLFTVEFAAIFTGLRYTTAGRMTVFLYLAPFVVAIGMVFIARAERLTRRALAGLLVAFVGVVVAFSDGFTAGALPLQWLGDALGIFAAIGWGATTLVIRGSALAPVHPAKTLIYQLGLSVLLLPAGLLIGERVAMPWTPTVTFAMVFQIVGIASTSYLVWFWLIRNYAAPRLSAFTLLTPVISLFAGAWLLHEPLTPRILIGTACVLVGLAAVNERPSARKR